MKTNYPKLILNKDKDQSIRREHPWIFSGAINKIIGEAKEGDIVEVFSNKDEYLATGHYQPATIAVRVFSFEQKIIDLDFWKQKIQNAFDYRKQLGLTNNSNTNAYRLVNAEGDGMPAMIIDFYNGTAVLQTHSAGMHRIKNDIVMALQEIYGDKLKAVYDKTEPPHPNPPQKGEEFENKYLFGKSENTVIAEYGNKFIVDCEGGQKTGFFIDQRANRKLLSIYVKGKSVLNAFCYTGGFSVYAMNAGAAVVHSVDSSQRAIELTERNMLLSNELNTPPLTPPKNRRGNSGIHQSFVVDVFDFLKTANHLPIGEDGRGCYDIIILDPPAFAKHKNSSHNAVQGYKRINMEAMKRIKKGGLIFTFSCSQVINRNLFYNTIISAAIEANRKVRVVHHLSASPDHPVNIFHPEGEYLKGLVLQVE